MSDGTTVCCRYNHTLTQHLYWGFTVLSTKRLRKPTKHQNENNGLPIRILSNDVRLKVASPLS
jgi:hypothetical protein